MSTVAAWGRPCWKNATDNGASCTGIRVRRDVRPLRRVRRNIRNREDKVWALPKLTRSRRRNEMRLFKLFSVVMLVTALLGVSLTTTAKSSNTKATAETTVVGYISDSMCGLKHM